jgi:hypothetical protein
MPRPVRVIALFALCILSSLVPAPSRAAELATCFSPTATRVVIVGALDYRDHESFEPFPTAHRRDRQLVEYFAALGVPRSQIAYVADRDATLGRVNETLRRVASESAPGDLLFVYYTGHGYLDDDDGQGYFATYDAGGRTKGWAMRSIVATIDQEFRGSHALLVADACSSGALAEEVRRRRSRVAYAVLCSSQSNEESTGNWTFTDTLLDGLRGSAYQDADGDGAITLDELAASEVADLSVGEEQLPVFVTTSGFDRRTPLARAQLKRDDRIGRRVEVALDGETYRARIVDARGDSVKVHVLGDDAHDDVWIRSRDAHAITVEQYPVGSRIEVEWEGEWYAARVRATKLGVHLVSYDGYGEDSDEWVSSDRIRPRRRTHAN